MNYFKIIAMLFLVGIAAKGFGQPGEGGATLKIPGMEPMGPASGAKPAMPDSIKNLWNPNVGGFPTPTQRPVTGVKVAEPPSNPVEMNRDIEINAKAGPYVIFLMSYSGPKAPEMARKFVMVMRDHYKWNAYVFNYGAEEKRKEYERVQKLREEHLAALEKAGLKADVAFPIRTVRIDEHTGVLIGGYKKREEAEAALVALKKLDPNPLIGKVDLDVLFTAGTSIEKGKGETISGKPDIGYVNPFKRAIVAPNPHPDAPKEQHGVTPEEDLKLFRHFNREEPLTLFNCKKPLSLCIKQYNMQFKTMADAKQAETFMKRFEFFGLWKKGEWQDYCAHNAHNLAEGLRKNGFDAYVLHSKNCSYVTIGAYDSPQDPQLIAMQNFLEQEFRKDQFRSLDLMPRPQPMLVPGATLR